MSRCRIFLFLYFFFFPSFERIDGVMMEWDVVCGFIRGAVMVMQCWVFIRPPESRREKMLDKKSNRNTRTIR